MIQRDPSLKARKLAQISPSSSYCPQISDFSSKVEKPITNFNTKTEIDIGTPKSEPRASAGSGERGGPGRVEFLGWDFYWCFGLMVCSYSYALVTDWSCIGTSTGDPVDPGVESVNGHPTRIDTQPCCRR